MVGVVRHGRRPPGDAVNTLGAWLDNGFNYWATWLVVMALWCGFATLADRRWWRK